MKLDARSNKGGRPKGTTVPTNPILSLEDRRVLRVISHKPATVKELSHILLEDEDVIRRRITKLMRSGKIFSAHHNINTRREAETRNRGPKGPTASRKRIAIYFPVHNDTLTFHDVSTEQLFAAFHKLFSKLPETGPDQLENLLLDIDTLSSLVYTRVSEQNKNAKTVVKPER